MDRVAPPDRRTRRAQAGIALILTCVVDRGVAAHLPGPPSPGLGATAAALRVRSSEATFPCVVAAGKSYQASTGRALAIQPGGVSDPGDAEVLVASSVEITRALEGGVAADGTDVDIARIPWVLSVTSGNPRRLRGLDDLDQPGLEVWILGGPASYEARRAVQARSRARPRETQDGDVLRAAPVALVPLSLAGTGERVPVDVAPIETRAAIVLSAAGSDSASSFVRYLGSEEGQRAFSTCR